MAVAEGPLVELRSGALGTSGKHSVAAVLGSQSDLELR